MLALWKLSVSIPDTESSQNMAEAHRGQTEYFTVRKSNSYRQYVNSMWEGPFTAHAFIILNAG